MLSKSMLDKFAAKLTSMQSDKKPISLPQIEEPKEKDKSRQEQIQKISLPKINKVVVIDDSDEEWMNNLCNNSVKENSKQSSKNLVLQNMLQPQQRINKVPTSKQKQKQKQKNGPQIQSQFVFKKPLNKQRQKQYNFSNNGFPFKQYEKEQKNQQNSRQKFAILVKQNKLQKKQINKDSSNSKQKKKKAKQNEQKDYISLKTFFTSEPTAIQKQQIISKPNININTEHNIATPQNSNINNNHTNINNNHTRPILKNPPNPNKQIPIYTINNLIYLFSKIPNKILKLYISQLSEKHGIAFNKIFIYYSIQQIINLFYQTHDIQCIFNDKYILSQLQLLIPQYMYQIGIKNWFILKRIIQGVFNRFRIRNHYSDEWLVSVIKKKRKMLKDCFVNVDNILIMSRNTNMDYESQQNQEQPSQIEAAQLGYSTLREYLIKNYINTINTVQLEDTDDQIIESSQKVGIQNKLNYYRKIKQKSMQQNMNYGNNNNKNNGKDNNYGNNKSNNIQQTDIISQESSALLIPFDFEIIKFACKIPYNAQILSQYQDNATQNSVLGQKAIIKQNKMKQKEKEKQKIKQNNKNKKQKQKVMVFPIKPIKICKSNSKNHANNEQQIQQQNTVVARKTVPTMPHPIIRSKNNTNEEKKQKQSPQQVIKKQQLLAKLDQVLYAFFLKQPDFTSQAIVKQIQRILKQDLKVPAKFHQQISMAWFKQYLNR